MRRLLLVLVVSVLTLIASSSTYAQTIELAEDWACVSRVVDGDTIALEGYPNTVRLAGINAPEMNTPLGPVARQRLAEWITAANCWVWIEPALPAWDRGTNRYRAHIWIEDPLFGWYLVQPYLVAEGLAEADYGPYRPDQYAGELRAAQDAARAAGLGIWSAVSPTPTALPTIASRGNCDPAYPDVCIPSPPPDLDCRDVPYRRFRVLPPDPHRFDSDRDGIGCES